MKCCLKIIAAAGIVAGGILLVDMRTSMMSKGNASSSLTGKMCRAFENVFDK